ncbi:hypothetical protein [Hymenobacter sp. B1770]|uniref:hypothetical protein n=1 Tax=Hymenobacter sp. B1770 TaxID=1718788 RepID=UPI003CED298C
MIEEATLNFTLFNPLSRWLGMPGILLGAMAALFASMWYVPLLLCKQLCISFRESTIRLISGPAISVSGAGVAVFLHKIPMLNHWLWFLPTGAVAAGITGIFVWLVYLRELIREYVPVRLRRYLRVQG